jgi:hypothetical protein
MVGAPVSARRFRRRRGFFGPARPETRSHPRLVGARQMHFSTSREASGSSHADGCCTRRNGRRNTLLPKDGSTPSGSSSILPSALPSRTGRALPRSKLQNPATFAGAARWLPSYPPDYNYERYAHVRLARLPLEGSRLRKLLESILPGWDEILDWSLYLERESFFLAVTTALALVSLSLRARLGWHADHCLRILRFHLRRRLVCAGAVFLTTPEIK